MFQLKVTNNQPLCQTHNNPFKRNSGRSSIIKRVFLDMDIQIFVNRTHNWIQHIHVKYSEQTKGMTIKFFLVPLGCNASQQMPLFKTFLEFAFQSALQCSWPDAFEHQKQQKIGFTLFQLPFLEKVKSSKSGESCGWSNSAIRSLARKLRMIIIFAFGVKAQV